MSFNKFGTGIIPDDCNTVITYPALEADQECTTTSSIGVLSQVCDLYIRFDQATTTPTAFTTAAMLNYFNAEVDNSNTNNTKVRWLVIEGGVPVPNETIQELSKNREKVTKRTYTLSGRIANLSDQNREFLRYMQSGGTGFTFWYGTTGGKMFGKVDGIAPSKVSATLPLGEGREDTEIGNIILTFESDIDPERINSPA